jgi:diadenosine tetraphosphate (Ap4A) HIT family hydrolase
VTKNCPLCLAVTDAQTGDPKHEFNTPLYETANFFVLPCVGPLIEGHVLIVSKIHKESLAALDEVQLNEVISILSFVRSRTSYRNSLITEHGSLDDQAGGACIVHCHIHIIPEMGRYNSALDPMLPVTKLVTLKEILRVSYPYILSMQLDGEIKLYQAYNAYSQMMRKAICSALKRNDGDWKQSHDVKVSKKTIGMWKSNSY